MAVEDLMTRPVTLLRRQALVDEYANGSPIPPDEEAVFGELQQITREEPGPAGEVSAAEWRLFLPAACANMRTVDAVEVDGVVYELTGAPWPVWNPRLGGFSHVEATVVRAG